MKKLSLFTVLVLSILLSFATPTPEVKCRSFGFNDVTAMKEYVKIEGEKIRATGWKYSDIKIDLANGNFNVTVFGTKTLAPGWSGCSETAWGAPYASVPTNLDAAASIAVSNYNNQGYNCVCRVNQQHTISNGEWTGYVMCVTVTAKVSALCDCIPTF